MKPEQVVIGVSGLPDCIPTDAWADFEQHRQEKRKPITSVGRKRLIAKLVGFHGQGQDVRAILDRSIENGWTGVFALPPARENHQSVSQRAVLAWAEVREAVKAGRGKVWRDLETATVISLMGGWSVFMDLRSDQAQFIGRNFERVFAQVASQKQQA